MQCLSYDQIIIAGGDEDVSADDLFEWVAPLLAGIPGGHWASCQLEHGPENTLYACIREGASGLVRNVALDGMAHETRALLEHLPEGPCVTMILLSDFASQAVTLLDGIARWLNIYETAEGEIAPVLHLMAGFTGMMAAA